MRLVLPLFLLSGCAAGAPVGGPADALELGAEELPLSSDVFVDIEDEDGNPVLADTVWVATPPDGEATARCMANDCGTWVAEVYAEDEVTAYAEVCGFVYLEPLEMAAASAVHVTVTADTSFCSPTRVEP